MISTAGLLGVFICLQVPPPDQAVDPSAPLRAERQAILNEETTRLKALADRLAAQGQADAATAVRAAIEPATPPEGPIRFVPLPEVVPAAEVPRGEGREERSASARRLFDLAVRAAAPGSSRSFALADACLRGVLDREPDHAAARRLLGYVPHQGGWATPHAAAMLGKGLVAHPIFGWVDADWVPHLERGELPGRVVNGKVRDWLPAAEADRLRRDWKTAWTIQSVPHFEIRTNVPLSEAIAFGRRLEAFRDLFFAHFADVIGPEQLPLAQRFANPRLKANPPRRKHHVWYFATREEYIDLLRRRHGDAVRNELGRYDPDEVKGGPGTSFFFRDEEGQIGVTATLYHEASHQLLFESAGRTAYEKNAGHFWVWEGLGTYFETLAPQADGSLQIGGLVGPRIAQARQWIVRENQYVPSAELIALGRSAFNNEAVVHLHYAEAMALTVFLLHAEGGRYRQAFLDYVADVYRGRYRPRGTAPALSERLGISYRALDDQLHRYLQHDGAPSSNGGSD